jgi:hypothetical protein
LCLVFVVCIFSPIVFAQVGKSEALQRVFEAEVSLKDAYLSLFEIEKAGAEVTELASLHNTALEYYQEANRVFEEGDYDLAITFADKAIEESGVILKTDVGMIFITEFFKVKSYRNQLVLSIGVSGIIILLSLFSWRVFKNYYLRNTIIE